MAIAEMTHIRLIGLKKSESKIIDRLVDRGLFEVRATDETSFDLERGEASLSRELKLKQSRVAFAIDFLEKRYTDMSSAIEKAIKKGEPISYVLAKRKFEKGVKPITRDDYSDTRAKEYELLNVCDELQRISFDIIDCKTRTQEANNVIRTYEPYAELPIRLSQLKRTGSVVVAAFASPSTANPCEALDGLNCAYELAKTPFGLLAVTVCRDTDEREVEKALGGFGFSRCVFSDDCTAAQKIEALQNEIADIEREVIELNKNALDYLKYYDELKILYDVFEHGVERNEADEKFLKTDSTFILEGWLPTVEVKSTVEELRVKCPEVFVQTLAPEEKDNPPSLAVNKKIVEPYEQITNMSSPPRYRELDPTPVMSVFFFLFFGLMIGDAGYGFVLAAVGLALGLSKKMGKGTRMLLLLVGMGGVSAVIWGIVFGGYFAVEFSKDISLWFNPLEDPIMFLGLAVAFGVVQLTTGFIIKFIKLCKDGKPLDAIFDAGSIILLFGALGCLAATILLKNAPKGFMTAAIVLAATGGGMLLIFGGRHKKGVFGKIFGGFKEIYGLINLFSDILSYSRIFGLGLATVAIGMAFNTLGSLLFNIPGIGYPLGIILLIPLHAFNMLIGVLGSYVHNARLQFLEFYGKFYDGNGRLFVPLGSRGKYTHVVGRGETLDNMRANNKKVKTAATAEN
ncbi:MAG: V-type ATP synthase subunit I [Clostridiales bacterium]|nr:V-type ATP synthase subunit I [Clostridiales bacterium]